MNLVHSTKSRMADTRTAMLCLQREKRESQGARRSDHAIVVTRESDTLTAHKVHGRQMNCIESSHRSREWLERPRQRRWRKLDQSDSTEQRSRFIPVRAAELARVDARPNLVFDQSTRDQRLRPQRFGRGSVFGEQMGQRHGRIEVDQRSLPVLRTLKPTAFMDSR